MVRMSLPENLIVAWIWPLVPQDQAPPRLYASRCSQDCQALSTQYQKMQDEFNDGGFNQAAIQGIQVMVSLFSSARSTPIRSADHSFPTIHCGPHTALVPRH